MRPTKAPTPVPEPVIPAGAIVATRKVTKYYAVAKVTLPVSCTEARNSLQLRNSLVRGISRSTGGAPTELRKCDGQSLDRRRRLLGSDGNFDFEVTVPAEALLGQMKTNLQNQADNGVMLTMIQ